MSQLGAGPADAGTVPVRVQVIDLEPFALDLVVPTYLPARDLTQRVARDAGLGAYWEDGSRRLFWLRARGRLLQDEERLEDLGIVPHELLHLLPQPPEGSGVQERIPEYPENKGYAAAGTINALNGLVGVMVWTGLWALALTVSQSFTVGILPSLGLSLLCTSFARHLLGGQGSNWKVPIVGLFVYLPLVVIACMPGVALSGVPIAKMAMAVAPGIIGGMIGVGMAWLAWYGAVEALPQVTRHAEVAKAVQEQTWQCGICGGTVTQDVRADCVYQCGRVFHVGCYRARQSVSRSDGCAVCGYTPAA